jgi:uncharacterized membrane protein YuzA (DUF378 family)
MRGWSYLFLICLIIGGLNWGVIGVTPDYFNVIHWVTRNVWIDRIIYWIIGFSALWWIFAWGAFVRPRPKGGQPPYQG